MGHKPLIKPAPLPHHKLIKPAPHHKLIKPAPKPHHKLILPAPKPVKTLKTGVKPVVTKTVITKKVIKTTVRKVTKPAKKVVKVHPKVIPGILPRHKLVKPRIIRPKIVIVPTHKRRHHHRHHTRVPAKKPETHLAIIFRTFTRLIKGTLNTAWRLTTPITRPFTRLTTKVTTLTRATTTRALTVFRPITTTVTTVTRPVVTVVTALTRPISTRVARLGKLPFVDCFTMKTWTGIAKCLWKTEMTIINKIIDKILHL